MLQIRSIIQCFFSPKLYKVYGGPAEQVYEPSVVEKWGDHVIVLLNVMWNLGLYTSPFIAGIMYRKGYFIPENLMVFTKFATTIGVIYVTSLCLRGVGRANNEIYQTFLKILQMAQKKMTPENKQALSKYDFDFSAWPVEFKWSEIQSPIHKKQANYLAYNNSNQTILQRLMIIPYKIIGTVAVHTFGLRIIYPGSLSLLQGMLSGALLQGRSKLVVENSAQRYKLKARDNNDIDVMFVDRRDSKTNNSRYLVICCEGNAGFYEIGIMGTPISAGYSVLGWNHPGFAWSTGKPYPLQEQNAIEIVIEFAVHNLKFEIDDILLFGWSIGGYVSAWAAMNYPDIKGVILDATFDDILPLAIQHMPSWWEPIVTVAIRDHVDLNNYEQLCRYPGPVLFIRRTDDEVICTIENNISTNRGNYMLLKMLKYRYPILFNSDQLQTVTEYLSINTNQGNIPAKFQVDQSLCLSIMQTYISEHSKSYPMQIGQDLKQEDKTQLTLYLAQKYMKDYRSSHCTPLPVEMFLVPWDVNIDNDYVFT